MARFILLLFVAGASAPVTTAQREREVRAGEAYLAHVLRYSAGQDAQVTGELAKWTSDELQLALRGLPAALVVVTEKERIGQPTLVANAMVMHVHIARNAERPTDIGLHLSIGQRLADLLLIDEPTTAFRARWHLVAGTIMFSLSRSAEAQQHFATAHKLRPEDPAILLAVGSVHEMQASMLGRSNISDEAAEQRLRQTLELYHSALSRAPDLHEARLRLARIYTLLGDVEAAATAIAAMEGRTSDGYLRFLALLIQGNIAETEGHWDQAIASYTEARSLCRACQSATLALSQAFVRTGKRAVAQKLVDQLVNDELWPPPTDPWWLYRQGQWHSVDRLLDELRREVPK